METLRVFFKLLVSLLVVLPFYSRKGCISTSAASAGPSLLDQDVHAVRALLKLTNNRWISSGATFSRFDCDTQIYKNIIVCDCSFHSNTTCRVTELDFSSQGIVGHIPEEIGNLEYLAMLYLSGNNLQGPIPKSFANLTKLQYLDLCNNQLQGPIPSFLREMKLLRRIGLCNNWFNGTIPRQLGELQTLELLLLHNNLLSGRIPKELGNISRLQYLYLSDNKLGGQLPDDLGNLTNLQEMYLMNNKFSGVLPSRLNKLQKLDVFNAQGNNLSGKFPNVTLSLPRLQLMLLTGNSFEGPLTNVFAASKDLYYLEVTNLLGGEKGFQFPELSHLKNLQTLTLRNCSLSGRIPDFIWQLPNLTNLDLSFNNLTGGIPASINHQSLDIIYLRRNKFNQSLPWWLVQKKMMTYVDVSENQFTIKSLPTHNISQDLNLFECCSNITNMAEKWQQADFHCSNETFKYDNLYINCGGEELPLINGSNTYEADLGQHGGSTFFLSKSGRWAYSSMGYFTEVYEDQYILNKTCNLTMADASLYQTARVAPVSLKYYGFCLKNNTYTVKLHFAEIGWDADQVLGTKDRRVFDVDIQGNKFLTNFNIEAEAGGAGLNVTKEYNVTVNDSRLEIHLYWSGKGSTEKPSPYYGPLISAISVSSVPKEHQKLSSAAKAGIGVSASLSVIIILLLFWRLGWFGGKKRQGEGIELYPGGVFNFKQIKAATQNFDAANKLGEGGFGPVYKGVLENGNEIAVKQLSARSRQGIREFVNEIGTISALHHPNLVRLMGCCVEENQLLLVYEYMQYNSLDHALFGTEELRSRLGWPTRVKLCLDIAKGLAFLHEESKVKIIHRDIKPTNILIDKDLNAKISDFGFAKLYEEEKAHVITRIQGTTGYMAPEYAIRGHLTPKADVYSFGVVTLEIVSGKNSASYRPNDQTVYLLDLAYVLQEQGNLLALIDPNLGSQYNWKQATAILELAMLCTNPSPTLRPTMSEVVKVLQGKGKIKTTAASVPYSTDNFRMAKAEAGLSQSSHSGSSSQQGTSSTTIFHSASKEIEQYSFGADNSSKTIIEQTEKSTNESILSADNSAKASTNPDEKAGIESISSADNSAKTDHQTG